MVKAVIIYCSFTGNTKKVANSIAVGLEQAACEVTLLQMKDAQTVNLYDYDLVCFGVPSINWYLPKPAADYLKEKFSCYKEQFGPIPPCAPSKPGKNALLFCTWSGPHTGIREAIPCMLAMEQYFEHLGFTVLDEWYVLSEFIGDEINSTKGRMGDIRGLPSSEDLARISQQAENLVTRL